MNVLHELQLPKNRYEQERNPLGKFAQNSSLLMEITGSELIILLCGDKRFSIVNLVKTIFLKTSILSQAIDKRWRIVGRKYCYPPGGG